MENNTGKGRYFYMRSSEDRAAACCWGEPEYDEKSERWYESCGCGFACYRDGIALQEDTDLGVEQFNNAHPQIKVKETTFELIYDDDTKQTSEITVVLVERDKGRTRSYSFTVEHASPQRVDEIIEGIRCWHCSGELHIGDFSCYPCSGAWRD